MYVLLESKLQLLTYVPFSYVSGPFTAYVGNLKYDLKKEELKNMFENVKDIRMIKNHQTGKFKGFAFVEFENQNSLNTAILKNGFNLKGLEMVVKPADPKAKKPRLSAASKVATESVAAPPPPATPVANVSTSATGGPKFNIYIS